MFFTDSVQSGNEIVPPPPKRQQKEEEPIYESILKCKSEARL